MPAINLPVDEIINLYVEEEWNVSQIANKFGVNFGTIKLRLDKARITLRSFSNIQKKSMNRPEVLKRVSEASKRSQSKRKATNLKNYGYEVASNGVNWKDEYEKKTGHRHPNQREESKKLAIENCMEKYGVCNVAELDETKEKIRQNRWLNKTEEELDEIEEKTKITNIERWDFKNAMQNKKIKQKFKKSRWDNKSKEELDKIKDKSVKTLFENRNEIIRDKLKDLDLELLDEYPGMTIECKLKCLKCNYVFTSILDYVVHDYGLCPKCYPKTMSKHFGNEIDLFVREHLTEKDTVISDYRKILPNKKELDTYIKSRKIAFEYDGLFWHCDKMVSPSYHIDKTNNCEKLGIRLIHVFEDEWYHKKEIVKSRVKNILGINDSKLIHTRKCEIKEINTKEKNEFLDTYHLQGKDNSNIKLGAFHNGELVSVMTFSHDDILKKDIWKLSRFCSNYEYKIPEIENKFLIYFKRNYEWKEIYSYVDRRWSQGNIYNKLGFEFVNDTKPTYWYFKQTTRIHRFSLRKRKDEPKNITEWELRANEGYKRIWDCGYLKFKLEKLS